MKREFLTAVMVRPEPHTSSTISVGRPRNCSSAGNWMNEGQAIKADFSFFASCAGKSTAAVRMCVMSIDSPSIPPGTIPPARDHYHRGKFTAELRQEVIDQSIEFLPGDEFASILRWLH